MEYDRLPEEIVLGKTIAKVMECRRATDGDGKERGYTLRFNPATNKLEVQRELTAGDEAHVTLSFVYRPMRGDGTQVRHTALAQAEADRTLAGKKVDVVSAMTEASPVGRAVRRLYVRQAGTIHSHPGESPFSTIDLANTISQKQGFIDLVSTSDGKVHALVTTHETNWVSPEEAKELQTRWTQLINERYRTVGTQGIHALRDRDKVFANAVAAMVRTVAKKYKLGYYVGDATGLLERVK